MCIICDGNTRPAPSSVSHALTESDQHSLIAVPASPPSARVRIMSDHIAIVEFDSVFACYFLETDKRLRFQAPGNSLL